MVFAEFRELKTQHLLLRKLRREDARDYFERLAGCEAVTRYMLFDPHKDISESEASMEKTLRRYEEGAYRWGITLTGVHRIIGVIDLLRLDPVTECGSFAYMLAEEFWGKGYGTEALKAVLDFAFGDLKLKAVEADHMVENPASGAVMRKAGMNYVRTERAKYEKHGIPRDAEVYRIEAENWKAAPKKILVSACLTGKNCKYSGGNNYSEALMEFLKDKEAILVCPELLAGLGVPRNPIEIVDGVLMDREGRSVDEVLRRTVARMVESFRDQRIDMAILQSRSPTCGINQIYDGTFSGRLIPGMGVFARALKNAGIRVVDVEDLGGTEYEL